VRTAVRRSPAARMASARGAVFVEEAGWEIPMSHGDDGEEARIVREAVGVADITARAKADVRGRIDAALPAAAGALVARISEGWAVVLGGPGEETRLVPALEAAAGSAAMVTDATHLFAGYALVGTRVPELLARATSWDPSTLHVGEVTGAPIVDVRTIVVRRDLSVPLLEVYCATEFGRYAWEALVGIADRLGGGPVGWQTLRARGWS
jgi:glycine cleavage system aminomethyltransferase T